MEPEPATQTPSAGRRSGYLSDRNSERVWSLAAGQGRIGQYMQHPVRVALTYDEAYELKVELVRGENEREDLCQNQLLSAEEFAQQLAALPHTFWEKRRCIQGKYTRLNYRMYNTPYLLT